ncbi:MAG: chemotaxis protein CheW [Acidimicrobiia bacterium]
MDNSELDEVIAEFLVESRENLDQLDQALVSLEQVSDPNVLAAIFRTIHTIKGTAGFLGFSTLESVTHVGENLLSKLRDGELALTTQVTDALLAMADAVRGILDAVEAGGDEGTAEHADLVDRLHRLDRGLPLDEQEVEVVSDIDVTDVRDVSDVTDSEIAVETDDGPTADVRPLLRRVQPPEASGVEVLDDEAELPIGERLIRLGMITDAQLRDVLEAQAKGDPRHVGELLVEREAVGAETVVEVLKAQQEERVPGGETIRVDVGLLDDLMNLVGELVLARNQILQFTQDQRDQAFNATSQRLNLITTELQEGVMKTRMQPIEHVWSKFPRVVRDLTNGCGKRARLEMEGKHTELDKTLLEAIKDPLTHLVRNAIDHGLETPEARLARGKSPEGVVRLRAYHEGGQVILEISDDGAGIDPAIIRRKAVQKGVLTHEEAAARSDREILAVIFRPGFSTAEQVSSISGRGVGMDVVKTNIESIGGSVDVQSVVGVGTTFKVKIPLTLAIIPALIVMAGNDRYAIPQVSLLELVHAVAREDGTLIEEVHGAPVYRLRGRLLPLVFLSEVYGRKADRPHDAVSIVVLQADDREFGLVVDEINDTAEIVVKPLGRLLKNAPGFAGATIMGDGRVALILDVMGLAQHVQVGRTTRAGASQSDDGVHGQTAGSGEALVLVGIGDRRFAVPLAMVARLEELPASSVRDAGDRQVVHYRDELLPLVRLAHRLGVQSSADDDGSLQVIVCGSEQRGIGLVVDAIYDIVEERITVSDRTSAFGVLGTAVIQGVVTDVLDLAVLVEDAESLLPAEFAA